MKTFLPLCIGLLIGIVTTIGVTKYIHAFDEDEFTLFSNPLNRPIDLSLVHGGVGTTFEVIQVVNPDKALVYLSYDSIFAWRGDELDLVFDGHSEKRIVLLYDKKNEYAFFDNDKIFLSKGETLKHIGIYRYTSKLDQIVKTVPVVLIE